MKYDQEFTSIHDKIESLFVKNATKLMDSFLDPSAGVAYLDMYDSVSSVLHLAPRDLI